jgi:hypothetical protein
MKDVRTEVLVFRTDIVGKSDSENVKQILKDSRIKTWNIDQQDIDNVLRIESNEVSPAEVIEMVTKLGYMCEELPE